MKKIIIVVLILLSFTSAGAEDKKKVKMPVTAPEQASQLTTQKKPVQIKPTINHKKLWDEVKKACDICFNDGSFFLEISGVEGKLPRLSRDERQKAIDSKQKFLLDAATIISEIERNEEQIQVLNEYLALKGKQADTGPQIVDDVMKIKTDLVTAKAKLNENIRKIEAYIRCGDKLD